MSAAKSVARPGQARNNALAQIHMAKAQLGMDDDTYRAMLWAQAGVKSAAELDHAGRAKVLAYLSTSGARLGRSVPNYKGRPAKPADDRKAQIGKVEALLADAGRPWAYAHSMCQRMFKVDRVEFCKGGDLQRLIAALMYDQKRRAERAELEAKAEENKP